VPTYSQKMQKTIKYTIFKTKWGYFGLAGTPQALLRTHLPGPEPEKVKSTLLSNLPALCQVSCGGRYDKTFFKLLQQRIAAYFEAGCENFDDIPVVLDGLSTFAQSVLTACRDIALGQTISYGQLAKRLGRAGSARAVGAALAKNPLPLIISCHRVICTNGKVGGFSAAGEVDLKEKLLDHERKYSLTVAGTVT
jgi:methylated-DNA-[protein]-cysteine S-methyltransferase